jgi:hypothetical protein
MIQEDNNDNERVETIGHQLQALHQCTQTLASLVCNDNTEINNNLLTNHLVMENGYKQ